MLNETLENYFKLKLKIQKGKREVLINLLIIRYLLLIFLEFIGLVLLGFCF